MKRQFAWAAAACLLAGCGGPIKVEWKPEAAMDNQLFPALAMAASAARPITSDADEAKQNDPYLLGDKFGLLGISIKTSRSNASVKITIKENDFAESAIWTGNLGEANRVYYIAPKINYKVDRLAKIAQNVPATFEFVVEVNREAVGSKTESVQIHSFNECPYAVTNSEVTIDDQKAGPGFTNMGWMFAAYVNENHASTETVVQEALATKIAGTLGGYQSKDRVDVLKQVYAIWVALQKRGVEYSAVTEPVNGSEHIKTQRVRFLDQSANKPKGTCVDGSLLFASVLRKIGLDTFLITVPGHMYVGFWADPEGQLEREYFALETTLMGLKEIPKSDSELPQDLVKFSSQIAENDRTGQAWLSFVAAIVNGTNDYQENEEKFDGDDPEYQTVNIGEERAAGIQPIEFAGNQADNDSIENGSDDEGEDMVDGEEDNGEESSEDNGGEGS